MNSDLIAKRANSDQEILLAKVMPLIDHSSSSLREHLQKSLTANKFNTKQFALSQMQVPLSNIMVAGHLAGANRTMLIFKGTGKQLEASLELSILSSAVAFANKVKINLQKIRDKYKTTAFNVLTNASKDINEELHETVKQLIKNGAHIKEAKEVLQAKFDKLGIRPASKGQFETIFRTQLQIAFAAGKYAAERNNPFIYRELWGYKYITNEDTRVRPMHAVLDGVCLPKDDPFWDMFYPPNGFNCRCQAIPIFTEMPIVRPQEKLNGVLIRPDKGFSFKAGTIFNSLAS